MLLQIVQDSAAALTDASAAPQQQAQLDYFELALKGGIIMIPIVILLVMAIYITIERWLTIGKAAKVDPNFMANVKDMVANGNIAGAKNLCQRASTPIARMLEKGISRIGKPMKNIEVSIENTGKLEIYKLEKGLAALATVSGAAPMLGFLGTVTGMVTAFFDMAKSGNNVEINTLAGGIYEALVTTIAGLIVGIFAYIAYNMLTASIERVVHRMEAAAVEFLDLLQEPA
jgi:biopolymer transport protein ExbB